MCNLSKTKQSKVFLLTSQIDKHSVSKYNFVPYINTPAEVRKEINEARSGGKRTVLMRIKKGDSTRFVALPVGRG